MTMVLGYELHNFIFDTTRIGHEKLTTTVVFRKGSQSNDFFEATTGV